ILLVVLGMLTGCTNNGAPEPPPSNKALIRGQWISETTTYRVRVNNNMVNRDSVETGIELIFNGEQSSVVTNLLDPDVQQQWLFRRDTLRYNFDPFTEDTLFFIENFVARDTLVVETLSEDALSVVVEEKNLISGS